MSIRLKNTLASALSAMSGTQLGTLHFLGSGGPFDVIEGTTSVFISIEGKSSVLVDCGPMVYSRLREQGVGMDISTILLTSCSESSLGSLATLVSHLYQERGAVDIVSMEVIERSALKYLRDVCGIPKEAVNFSLFKDGSQSILNAGYDIGPCKIRMVHTEPGAGALIMDFGGFKVLHSGQVNSPVFGMMDEAMLKGLLADADNTIVLHDASLANNGYGCHYELLSEWSDKFKQFFIFNHNRTDGERMVFSERYMRSLSTNGGNNEFIIEKQTIIA